MKKIIILIGVICSITGVRSQDVQVWKLPDLVNMYNADSATTYVINFWATWCAPCIREIPYFEKLQEESAVHNIKVTLVSLDFADKLETRVIPFVEKRKLKSTIVLLDESNYNYLIPKISESWTGSIPATLVVNQKLGIYEFKEGEFKSGQLNKWLEMIGVF